MKKRTTSRIISTLLVFLLAITLMPQLGTGDADPLPGDRPSQKTWLRT